MIFIFTSLAIFLATIITNSGTGSGSPQKIMKTRIDYSFIRKWGSNGTGDRKFIHPHAIDVDSKRNDYVGE